MPASHTSHQERLATLLGHAIRDEPFAMELQKNPPGAARGLGLTLRIDEVVALKGLDIGQMAAAAQTLRSPLATRATFDQQQVRTD
ncbi:Os1348 family NHLP clan protein [Pseudomonas sp. FEN]|uniref:Os1348 family NHLP clan protein n=1 Tax=Pseudomonas sp. FEN TaxID=2767468 RepID=UPI001CD6DC7D|nr:Os1348 family NHLP clan protein [Pseudomonas sp. FEN]